MSDETIQQEDSEQDDTEHVLMTVTQKGTPLGIASVESTICYLDGCQNRFAVHASYTVHLFQQCDVRLNGTDERYHMTLGNPFLFFCSDEHRQAWLSKQVVRVEAVEAVEQVKREEGE